MVDTLPGNEPEIIRKRYQEGLTFKEIGEETGFVYGSGQAMGKKRSGESYEKPSRSRILEEFLEDSRIYNSALHGNVFSFNGTWTSSTERVALKRYESSVL